MSVQQRRVSKSRKGMRRSHHFLEETKVMTCKNCGVNKLPHRVCPSCGVYNDKKIFNK